MVIQFAPPQRILRNWKTIKKNINFSQTKQYFQHFNFQLTHATLKNLELLKHFKISKTAPTCFGLQGNHHQGASQYLAKNYTLS